MEPSMTKPRTSRQVVNNKETPLEIEVELATEEEFE
jgi:hypothetical protein